jgi:ABC-type Fe3+/spermidine/putrescine transport system ATPase subunit
MAISSPAPSAASAAQSSSDVVLELDSVTKFYGTVKAVDAISINVNKGEVLTLLGPSGCGKTTTLRMVIGLERVSGGEIRYRDRVMDSGNGRSYVPTHKRNMGMVFQSYAIWPHMTVFENVAYPLRVRRTPNNVVSEKVERALDQVGLGGLGSRGATQLSGGQQQRVALARSLVFEPELLLLDEPFSNLDAKLREQMRGELKILQRRLGITVLFVTHDQIEALSLSDRIAVMNLGNIEQLGRPLELYNAPKSAMVRDFLGRTLILDGEVAERRGETVVVKLNQGGVIESNNASDDLGPGTPCQVAVRPEKVTVRPDLAAGGTNRIKGILEALLFIGDRYEARVSMGDSNDDVTVYMEAGANWQEGQEVSLEFPANELRVWPV